MAQDWASAMPAGAPQTAPPVPVAMRPLSLGEILDRIFTIFRSHFWLFAGLAGVGSGWTVILQGLQLLVHHFVLLHFGARTGRNEAQFGPVLTLPLALPVAAVSYAGALYAMGEVYLGRPMTVAAALRATRNKWLRYIGILLWHGWSAVWLPILLAVPGLVLMVAIKTPAMIGVGSALILLGVMGGGVYGVIAFLRNALALPASIVEGSGVRASMRRSKQLTVDAKGKLFVVLLIFYALLMVAGMIDLPLVFLIARSPLQEHVVTQMAMLVVSFVANMVDLPVILIGYMLVYFDQRIRKEGFDLLMLLGTPVAAPAAFPGLEPEPAAPPAYAELPLDPADPMGDDGRI
jgi:hypothetical protein